MISTSKQYIKNSDGDWILVTKTDVMNVGKTLPFTAIAPKTSVPLHNSKHPLSLEDCFSSIPSDFSPNTTKKEPSVVKRMRECGVSEDKIQLYVNMEGG